MKQSLTTWHQEKKNCCWFQSHCFQGFQHWGGIYNESKAHSTEGLSYLCSLHRTRPAPVRRGIKPGVCHSPHRLVAHHLSFSTPVTHTHYLSAPHRSQSFLCVSFTLSALPCALFIFPVTSVFLQTPNQALIKSLVRITEVVSSSSESIGKRGMCSKKIRM